MKTTKLLLGLALAGLTVPALFANEPILPGPSDDRDRAQPSGALSGATIFLSAGHGWVYNADRERWNTQRGNSYGIVEDHSNAEAVHQFLARYLWNSGANVITTRERDMQTNMVIMTPGDAGYEEDTHGRIEWVEEEAFGTWNGKHRFARTVRPNRADRSMATATFTPEIPEDGHYAVYAWYRPPSEGDASSATPFVIRHSGGETVWHQDQNLDAYTWRYMGTYHFEAGRNTERGSVEVQNVTDERGRTHASVSAIRFGGGMGDFDDGGGVSGYPRWEESGRYYSQFATKNILNSTRNFNTVTAMPLFSEWNAEPSRKGTEVYLSWHTNASRGTTRGLLTFVYSGVAWQALNEDNFAGYPGGDDFGVAVHNGIIDLVQEEWSPQWRDGGVIAWWLGETNPRNNAKMPMALPEVGFHDNPEDAKYILDPRFRDLASRGTYHGMVEYYTNHVDGFTNTTLLPAPPQNFRIQAGNGEVVLSWDEPRSEEGARRFGDPATGYRVYRSVNGHGFDNGFAWDGTSITLPAPPAGTPGYYRITATNEGGESFPTETLVVHHDHSDNDQRVLIVNGFQRLDGHLNVHDGGTAETPVQRGILHEMNSFNYTVQHGRALASLGMTFDSTSSTAIEAGHVDLAPYEVVVWYTGQEGPGSDALPSAQREALRGYLGNGGKVFISGSDLAADLAQENDGRRFLAEVFGVRHVASDAGTFNAKGSAGRFLSPVSGLPFGERGTSPYPVKTPDVIGAESGAQVILEYEDGRGAAVAKANVVYLAFPFETIHTATARARVMRESMRHLLSNNDSEPVALAN